MRCKKARAGLHGGLTSPVGGWTTITSSLDKKKAVSTLSDGFHWQSSSGRTRTYNPSVTRTLRFLLGLDYLIALLANQGRAPGALEALLVGLLSL